MDFLCNMFQEDQKETESRSSATKNLEDFVEMFKKNVPDPIVNFPINL